MNTMVHPASIPTLKYHLMSTTALTPTQHKSKGLGLIVGIVASIAIPFAAPKIAIAIGFSSAIGTALVGAGLGAGLAAIQGGNIALGALGGGISGGIAGASQFGSPFSAPTTGAASTGAAAASAPAAGTEGLISATSFTPPAGVSPGLFAPQTPDAFFSGAGATSTGFANASQPVDATDCGTGTGPGGFTGQAAGTAPGTFAAPGPQGATDFGTGANFTGQAAGTPVAPEQGFLAGLKTKAGDFLAENKDQILRTAGNVGAKALGNAFAGTDDPDMSDEERRLQGQLAAARAQEQRLLNERLGVANTALREARSINPDFEGRQLLVQQRNALARQREAAVRGMPRGSSSAGLDRKYALEASRLGGFSAGREAADAARRQGVVQAAGLFPTGGGVSAGIRKDLADASKYYDRASEAGDFLTGELTALSTGILGTKSEEEIKKKQQQVV